MARPLRKLASIAFPADSPPSGVAGAGGPFVGANLAQTWWFLIGALGVVYLATTTGEFHPEAANPSTLTTQIGLGWIAARLAFQVLMLAILAFIGIALFGPTLRVLGVW